MKDWSFTGGLHHQRHPSVQAIGQGHWHQQQVGWVRGYVEEVESTSHCSVGVGCPIYDHTLPFSTPKAYCLSNLPGMAWALRLARPPSHRCRFVCRGQIWTSALGRTFNKTASSCCKRKVIQRAVCLILLCLHLSTEKTLVVLGM